MLAAPAKRLKKKEVFYGWWICILGFIALTFSSATIWHGFTTFFEPLVNEFGWSYAAISFAASIRGVEAGLLDIIVGFLLDRIGIRRIILVGSILVGIGFLALSRVHSLPVFYLSFIIIAIGASGLGGVVFFSLISRWFRKRLGLTMGIVAAGAGAGGLALPAIVYLLDVIGFRILFVIFAVAALVIGGITSYFVRNRPEDIGSLPDNAPEIEARPVPGLGDNNSKPLSTEEEAYTFKKAISTPTFWIITYFSLVSMFSIMMVSTHIMPYLQLVGYSRYLAGIVAMIVPVLSIVGRVGIGWVSDFISHRVLLLILVLGQLIGVVLLLGARQSYLIIPFIMFFGISWGGMVVLRPVILRGYYGSIHIGSILGFCLGMAQAGNIAGPLFAGWVVDTRGDYILAWVWSIILLVSSLPLLIFLRKKDR